MGFSQSTDAPHVCFCSVTRYYIHIDDDDGFCRDGEGFNAHDLPAAMRMMKRAAGDIIAADLIDGETSIHFWLCLDDHTGNRLLTIPFSSFMGPPIRG